MTKEALIKQAKEKLTKAEISFECKNNDYHFIVEDAIDFWPTSYKALWIIRLTRKRNYGLDNLIKEIYPE